MTPDFLDMREIFTWVHSAYPRAGWLEQAELFSCWRPPHPPRKPWNERRIYAAIEACIAAGHIERYQGPYGARLRVTDVGLNHYQARRPE